MKAIYCPKYGNSSILELRDVEKPSVGKNSVLVKVKVASINAGDWHLMRGDPFLIRLFFGLKKPKFPILGVDLAGEVEAIGANVTAFQVGDRVVGDMSNCGYGAFAEYTSASQKSLVKIPDEMSYEIAASLPTAGVTALQGLRNIGGIQSGQKVLINGASGGVGSFAVQIAKALGATVTAVCSTRNLEMVKTLGADTIVDYKKENFTQDSKLYDLIYAVNGYHPITEYSRCLNDRGTYVMSGGSNKQMSEVMVRGPLLSRKNGKNFKNYVVKPSQDDLQFLINLYNEGKISPVISKVFSFDEIPKAIEYIEEGKASGKIVVNIQ